MLKHIVLLKFSDETPDGHIDAFREKMQALLPILPQIKSLEFGTNVLNDARSWHVSMIMSFDTVEDLRHYQHHPEHVAIADFNKAYLEDIATVDYCITD